MVPTTNFRRAVGQLVREAGGRTYHPSHFTFRGEALWRFLLSPELQQLLSTPRCPLCETVLHEAQGNSQASGDVSPQTQTCMRCSACGWSRIK